MTRDLQPQRDIDRERERETRRERERERERERVRESERARDREREREQGLLLLVLRHYITRQYIIIYIKDAFLHRSCYTQTHLHTDAFTHRSV